MTNSQRLAKVRARLLRWIADQHPVDHEPDQRDDVATQDDVAISADSSILRETILIRGEFFCGRRFYTANHYAVWFVEEDQLKIYQNSGELLCMLTGSQIEEEHGTEPASELPSILKLPRVDAHAPDSRESERRAA